MSAGYLLGAEQGISEPEGLTTEPEQPEETEERQPVASFGGEPAGHAQATGQATQPLAGYLQPAQFAGNHSGGGSFGGSAPQHQPAVAPRGTQLGQPKSISMPVTPTPSYADAMPPRTAGARAT